MAEGIYAGILLTLASSLAGAQTTFADIANERGVQGYVQDAPTGGVQAVDYDVDGDIDLYLAEGRGGRNALYRNDGAGQYVDVAGQLGLDSPMPQRTALWFDYDNDADLDLAVAGDCRVDPPTSSKACANPVNLLLFEHGPDGRFSDVTASAGLDVAWGGREDQHRGGLAAGDLDRNGYPDLYVATWNDRAYLFMNNGDGTFDDRTSTAGIGTDARRHHQPLIHDFDRDGWLDIYQPVDFRFPNVLWRNQGDARFDEVAAAAGVDSRATDMGVALGDYDFDGDLDLYVTNVTQGSGENREHNVLFRNDSASGNLSYTEVAESQGVDDGYWGWGAVFFDADLDGDVDLATTNGRQDRQTIWAEDPSRFFANRGAGPVWFNEVSTVVGFDDVRIGTGLIDLDLERDGDRDLVQVTMDGGIRLLENRLPDNGHHWLVVKPRSVGDDRFAAGSVVRVRLGERVLVRPVIAGSSTLSQAPYEAHFGLGAVDRIDEIVVEWPDGSVDRIVDVPADTVIVPTRDLGLMFASGFEP